MGGRGEKIRHYIKPMLATAVDKAFSSKEWLFELKLDGYRAIADVKKSKVLLYSRNGLSLARRFPTIVKALERLGVDAVLDGEIVLMNDEGKPDFQKLQNCEDNYKYPIVYYVFDILTFKKKDLQGLPLVERKKLLKPLLTKKEPIRYSTHILSKGEELFREIVKEDIEGVIAKKKDSLYSQGIRSREWLKIKNHKSQEAIIVGFTAPKGSRLHFGSLLLAQYHHKKLKYIGHAGTGFTAEILRTLMKKMKPHIARKCPLDKPVKGNGPVNWVKPKLVCEVSYTEITRDGILRHPVYKGLRLEKKLTVVKQETETPLPVKKIVKKTKSKKA